MTTLFALFTHCNWPLNARRYLFGVVAPFPCRKNWAPELELPLPFTINELPLVFVIETVPVNVGDASGAPPVTLATGTFPHPGALLAPVETIVCPLAEPVGFRSWTGLSVVAEAAIENAARRPQKMAHQRVTISFFMSIP
jgi:hypothetical protein